MNSDTQTNVPDSGSITFAERVNNHLDRLHAVEAVLASIEDLTAEASPDLPMQTADRIFSLAGLARSEVQSIRSALSNAMS